MADATIASINASFSALMSRLEDYTGRLRNAREQLATVEAPSPTEESCAIPYCEREGTDAPLVPMCSNSHKMHWQCLRTLITSSAINSDDDVEESDAARVCPLCRCDFLRKLLFLGECVDGRRWRNSRATTNAPLFPPPADSPQMVSDDIVPSPPQSPSSSSLSESSSDEDDEILGDGARPAPKRPAEEQEGEEQLNTRMRVTLPPMVRPPRGINQGLLDRQPSQFAAYFNTTTLNRNARRANNNRQRGGRQRR